ncbi:MAG: SufE family protein [Limisphaerales bacterium]
MSATVQSIDELVENFELLGDWESRFGYLIDLGKELPPLDAADQCEENRVYGCQAQVWLKFEPEPDGRITIAADSDAFIVKGLISVLLAVYSSKTTEEILAIDGEAELGRLDLAGHLSPTRKNGLYAMVQRVRELAAAQEASP